VYLTLVRRQIDHFVLSLDLLTYGNQNAQDALTRTQRQNIEIPSSDPCLSQILIRLLNSPLTKSAVV
jgi:hypothetical protein